jgi:Domain of unknown function (DUF1992)
MSRPNEPWVERQIREAQERGEFDNLPGAGKPLHLQDEGEDWWIKGLIRRERLDMTAALPPQLALRKEAHGLSDAVLRQHSEQAVRDLVEDFNARVRECWRRPVEGPLVAVRTVDLDRMLAHWRAHRPARPAASVAPAEPVPQRRGPLTWLRRAGAALRRRGRRDRGPRG